MGICELPGVFREERSALRLGEAAPDPVRLADPNREPEAVVAHVTLRADLLGVVLTRFSIFTPFRCRRWKEHRGFGTSTRCSQVPGLVNQAECHSYSVPEFPLSARKVSGRSCGDKKKFWKDE